MDTALGVIERHIVQQVGAEGCDGVDDEAAPGSVGVCDSDSGDGSAGEQTPGLHGRNGIVLEFAPKG